MKQNLHRQRAKRGWATAVTAAVVLLGVSIPWGSTRTQLRSTLPAFIARTKTGFLQLRTAVRIRLGVNAATTLDSAEPTSKHLTRGSRRPPRVVPFSKKP